MSYVLSAERFGIEKGLRQGLQEGLQQGLQQSIINVLETRFSTAPETLVDSVNQVADLDMLNDLHRQAILVSSLAEFEQVLHAIAPQDNTA